MDDEALKALLERQENARAVEQARLDADRNERAKVRAAAKQGLKLEPPGTPKQQVLPETVKVETHNLGIEDRRQMGRLDQDDLAELAKERLSPQGHKFNAQARDKDKLVLAPELPRTPPAPTQQRPSPLIREFNSQARDENKLADPRGSLTLPAQLDPAELARQEENQRFRDESLRRFGFMQGRERGLGRGLRRDGAAGTDE